MESFQVATQQDAYRGGGQKFTMNVTDDRFVHFTTEARAQQILEMGKLLMNPPYKKFGTDSVDAVSLTFGKYLPSVQLNHILKGQPPPTIVAVMFQTNVAPYAAYIEEVKWNQDVPLINPQIITHIQAKQLLSATPHKLQNDQDTVEYI